MASGKATGMASNKASDRILLRGMVFYGYHGVNPEEKALGQRFVVDAALERDLSAAGKSDDLQETVNYAAAYQAVKAVVEGESRDLLEAVAQDIADALLDGFDISAAWVRVKKPEVAIKGSVLDYMGVEIRRERQG